MKKTFDEVAGDADTLAGLLLELKRGISGASRESNL